MKIISLVILLILVIALPLQSDTSYFRELVNKGNATVYDGYRMIAILLSGQDNPDATYTELQSALSGLKTIPTGWKSKKESDFLTRSELAYMLFKSLEMKGGLTMRIFGVSERYAFRECVDKKLIVEGYAGQLLSGEELISILAEAEKYQQKYLPNKKPMVVVPAKPKPAEKIEPAQAEPDEEEFNPDDDIEDDLEDESDEDEPQPSK
jgi:hypothetical protein